LLAGTAGIRGQMSPKPILSIVIVNSDSTELTMGCLDSIYRHPPPEPFEIILVDNCSEIPCLPLVNKRFPQVTTRSAPQRQGFAKNYNLGMQLSQGQMILVLNNDTLVHPGALTALVEGLQEHETFGMAGPKLLSANGKIQTVCARNWITPFRYVLIQFLLDPALPTGQLIDRFVQWRLNRKASGPVPCISGACMLVKRLALEQVGLLDEGYDFYYEDIEWCHRFTRFGYQVAYIAEAEITHFGDSSLSKVKGWAKQSEYLSALRYFQAYHGLNRIKHWLIWIVTVLSYHMRWAAFSAAKTLTGAGNHALAYRQLSRWIRSQSPARVDLFSAQPASLSTNIDKRTELS
jgi:N-acetylglucosaminyl-diphospho-decaprenol L-rhamnosyltransferase